MLRLRLSKDSEYEQIAMGINNRGVSMDSTLKTLLDCENKMVFAFGGAIEKVQITRSHTEIIFLVEKNKIEEFNNIIKKNFPMMKPMEYKEETQEYIY